MNTDTTEYFIGVKKGTLSVDQKVRFYANQNFEFKGSPDDFIILPKQAVNACCGPARTEPGDSGYEAEDETNEPYTDEDAAYVLAWYVNSMRNS